MSKFGRRSLITGLVVLAGTVPAAAQADVVFDPANGTAQQVRPVPAISPATPTADPGFDWGDAAVGSGATIVVLGAASAVVAAGRRRRAGRPLAG